MKKFKKLWKVWNVVAIIMTFVVTFSVVYATGTYFYQRYGTPGALSDKVLTNTEWDALMEELDTFSCPEQDCPICPSCQWQKGYTSPNGKNIRKFRSNFEANASDDDHDWYLYDRDGKLLNWLGITNYYRPCWGAQAGWTMKTLANSANNSKFCGTMGNCVGGTYYVHGAHRWVKISVACWGQGNPNYATITKQTTVAPVSFPTVSGIDEFSNSTVYLQMITSPYQY